MGIQEVAADDQRLRPYTVEEIADITCRIGRVIEGLPTSVAMSALLTVVGTDLDKLIGHDDKCQSYIRSIRELSSHFTHLAVFPHGRPQ